MGGEGTWSLAAAEPDRWSAIVPICHGWKPNQAARLKNVPCWCFHGDADEVIPPSQSREMVRAIQEAGWKAALSGIHRCRSQSLRRPCLRHARALRVAAAPEPCQAIAPCWQIDGLFSLVVAGIRDDIRTNCLHSIGSLVKRIRFMISRTDPHTFAAGRRSRAGGWAWSR